MLSNNSFDSAEKPPPFFGKTPLLKKGRLEAGAHIQKYIEFPRIYGRLITVKRPCAHYWITRGRSWIGPSKAVPSGPSPRSTGPTRRAAALHRRNPARNQGSLMPISTYLEGRRMESVERARPRAQQASTTRRNPAFRGDPRFHVAGSGDGRPRHLGHIAPPPQYDPKRKNRA